MRRPTLIVLVIGMLLTGLGGVFVFHPHESFVDKVKRKIDEITPELHEDWSQFKFTDYMNFDDNYSFQYPIEWPLVETEKEIFFYMPEDDAEEFGLSKEMSIFHVEYIEPYKINRADEIQDEPEYQVEDHGDVMISRYIEDTEEEKGYKTFHMYLQKDDRLIAIEFLYNHPYQKFFNLMGQSFAFDNLSTINEAATPKGIQEEQGDEEGAEGENGT